jgi:hypothetical protein
MLIDRGGELAQRVEEAAMPPANHAGKRASEEEAARMLMSQAEVPAFEDVLAVRKLAAEPGCKPARLASVPLSIERYP